MKKIVLLFLVLASPAYAKTKYLRKEWKHWIDADKDGQDTRQEVLIRDSKTPNKSFQRQYIIIWYTIKTNWNLKIEKSFSNISNSIFTAD